MCTIPETEDQIRLVIEGSPEAIIEVDEQGMIERSNGRATELFGYTPEEFKGRSIETLVPERFRRGHAGQRAAYAEHPTRRRLGEGRDLVALRKDGTEFPAEIGLIPVGGNNHHVLAMVTDITIRKQAEDAIRMAADKSGAASRERSRYIVQLGREVRDPLTGLLRMLDLLLSEEQSEERRLSLLLAKTSAECVSGVFATILALSEDEIEKRED